MESPPNSKKLSVVPTSSKSSVSFQIAAKDSCTGVLGSTNSDCLRGTMVGRGKALRSSLPLGVSGRVSSTTKCAGVMKSGSFSFKRCRNSTARDWPSFCRRGLLNRFAGGAVPEASSDRFAKAASRSGISLRHMMTLNSAGTSRGRQPTLTSYPDSSPSRQTSSGSSPSR